MNKFSKKRRKMLHFWKHESCGKIPELASYGKKKINITSYQNQIFFILLLIKYYYIRMEILPTLFSFSFLLCLSF